MAATPSYPKENVWDGFWPLGFPILHYGVGGGLSPMDKFVSSTICIHDFELYPFDRELSYDFG